MRIVLLLSFMVVTAYGQTSRRYWVEFTDKSSTPYNIISPEDFLSPASISRRSAQNILIDLRDLPVDPNYVSQIAMIPTVNVWHTSKWFNAVSVEVGDSVMVDSILALPFVVTVDTVKSMKIDVTTEAFSKSMGHTNYHHEHYGMAFRQIEMLSGHLLHSLGYTGAGKTIAVLDAGFDKVNQVDVFQPILNEGRLLGTRDFVDGDAFVYDAHQHGTAVLSCMGAQLPGKMVGTAPGANYILIRTEEAGSESKVEEDNWIAGAEYADSLGADIFNTSLGYTTFDDSLMNYTYADMDGNTARISVAADIAASRGILVITSAGNSGNSPWHYISAPADADSSLAVAAVDSFLVRAIFSSYGPSADGDLKPNVAAMGFRTACTFPAGDVRQANGTSFSSPVLAGMAACLWQALPGYSNMEIKELIERHGHQYNFPDYSLGYGVPNFYTAYLEGKAIREAQSDEIIRVFPSQFNEQLHIHFFSQTSGVWKLTLVNAVGQLLFENDITTEAGEYVQTVFSDEIADLEMGTYLIHLTKDSKLVATEKVIKIRD